jgi:hypothetical protein
MRDVIGAADGGLSVFVQGDGICHGCHYGEQNEEGVVI